MLYRMYRLTEHRLEYGFYIETSVPLSDAELEKLRWLIAETFEPEKTAELPNLDTVVEIGPRLSIETPFSSNAVAIAHAIGLTQVVRIEHTRRYEISSVMTEEHILPEHRDRMTEAHYPNGIVSFETGITPEPVKTIPLLEGGPAVLKDESKRLGLGMDGRDIEYYYGMFMKMNRNPTDVELFQLGNANSEHSRHWFFKGRQVIDGEVTPQTLLDIVQEPLKYAGEGTRKAFNDNAGVMHGYHVSTLLPGNPGCPSRMEPALRLSHITATAETHNHPTFVAPFPGAATGAGGEIRDSSAVGRGGITGIGVAGYAVGNLFIPGYDIPGEEAGKHKPSTYASPLQILIEGSNGVSSYGNQYGRPLTQGFCRTYGQIVDGEWREWRKPILYSGGIGQLYDEALDKKKPEIDMLLVRLGGPAFPIGVGGGAASSLMQGQNTETLDYNSVQRGNAEMENRVNRVIRACAELGRFNPIRSIHDQGAGGPSNVLTELMEPLGGTVNIRGITLGDKTMSVLQIWSAEFQEGYGLLVSLSGLPTLLRICERERVNCEVLGKITGDGRVVVIDSDTSSTPVDLSLEEILTHMPQKTFESARRVKDLKPFTPPIVTLDEVLKNVFALPSVGSKGFLVHKVDRSVTGLVAGQQCCGIAQIPIADNSVAALGYHSKHGSAVALGEQPVKMLIDAKAGARLAVGEMLTNLASVRISDLGRVRCRANWMWAGKLPHEGASIYDAVVAMSNMMIKLGIAIDGGKDSLSMAATVEGELVKAPGSLVIMGYAPVEDVTQKVTPDIKRPGESNLYLIDIGQGRNRLGGSAFAQTFGELGNESPDVDDPELLKRTFNAVQQLIAKDLVLAVHDRSDGGLITTVAEMCMASRCGFMLRVEDTRTMFGELFSEELGFVLEVLANDEGALLEVCNKFDIPCSLIGTTSTKNEFLVFAPKEDRVVHRGSMLLLRSWWEETSYQLERLQVNIACAYEEHAEHQKHLPGTSSCPSYALSFLPVFTVPHSPRPRVAILREEGVNGEREMQAACYEGGLDPWDIAMDDLLENRITLDDFQGVVFAGGFSFMDVFGSAKGWAGTIRFNERLREMFDRFYAREDTFSLGICNGCQLMALLGWIPVRNIGEKQQPRFLENRSGRFESRWVQVEVLKSPSIMLSGMEGSRLGVWVAHGEGRLFFPDDAVARMVREQNLSPLAYIDPFAAVTEQYPYNPNGSPEGMTALCSPDGRHLAMMPHPERCVYLWQWPWVPPAWKTMQASPWLRMFQNATTWCLEHRS